ncbi:MAG: hypothetical protein AAFZ38_05825 [Myxococcota bacterium]
MSLLNDDLRAIGFVFVSRHILKQLSVGLSIATAILLGGGCGPGQLELPEERVESGTSDPGNSDPDDTGDRDPGDGDPGDDDPGDGDPGDGDPGDGDPGDRDPGDGDPGDGGSPGPRDCSSENRDEYGGCQDIHFDLTASPFFRVHKDGDQWWFVTPENNALLSFGLNHFHFSLWRENYNRDHWIEAFGGEPNSSTWQQGFYSMAESLLDDIGANTIPYHTEDSLPLLRPLRPHIRHYKVLELSLHQNPQASDYEDVFTASFAQKCDDVAATQVAPYKDDPTVLGFAMNDVPIYTEIWASMRSSGANQAPTWASVYRNMAGSAPGKQRYVEVMQNRYTNIQAFNGTYGTGFQSWDALRQAQSWRTSTDFDNAAEVADNNAFNFVAIQRYYRETTRAFRVADEGHHLFLGDKFTANLRDNSDLTLVVEAVRESVDVFFFQYYGRDEQQLAVQRVIADAAPNLPMMNGDGGFSASNDPRAPNPQYPAAPNQNIRADWTYKYADDAFSHAQFIGWGHCGVMDGWEKPGSNVQKPGVMNPLGEEHTVVLDAMRTIARDLYSFRQ